MFLKIVFPLFLVVFTVPAPVRGGRQLDAVPEFYAGTVLVERIEDLLDEAGLPLTSAQIAGIQRLPGLSLPGPLRRSGVLDAALSPEISDVLTREQLAAVQRLETGWTLLFDGVDGLRDALDAADAPALTFDQETQVHALYDDHARALDAMIESNGGLRAGIEPRIRDLEDQLFLAAIKFLNPAQRNAFIGSMSAAEVASLNADLPEDPDELREYLNDLRSPAGGGGNVQIDGFGGGRMPDRDEIQEIRINENAFTAERSQPGRGQTQILTRGGVGRLNGDFTFNFRDEALDARNAFANARPPYQRRNFNGNISGPVIRDVLTLTLTVQHNTAEDGDNLQALTPDGLVNDPVVRPGFSRGYAVRGTAQLAENHVLGASFSTGRQGQLNNVGNTRLPSQGNRQERDNANFQIKETASLGRSWNNEVEFRYQVNDQQRIPNSDGVHINVAGTLRTGGSQQDTRFRNTQYQFSDLLMYTGSRMAMRVGFDGSHSRNWSDSKNNYNGTFNFASLYDYCGVVANFAGPQCRIELQNAETRAAEFAADPANAGEALDITPRIETFSQRFGPSQSEVSQFQGSGFVQTDFRVRPDLTLSVGARYEWQQNLEDGNNLDPRLGFAYSIGSHVVLRGGTGIFHDRLSVSQVNNLIRSGGSLQQSIQIINPSYPDPFLGGTVEAFDPAMATVLVRAPELAAPYTSHSEVTVETSFSSGLVLTGSYRFIRGVHQYRERNLNAPFAACTALLGPKPTNEEVAPCRPLPDRGNIFQLESTGTSRDHSLRLGFRQRISYLNVQGSYQFSSNYSDAVDNPADHYDLAAEWGRDGARHRLNASVNVRLPWNVNMNTRTDWQSGEPYTLRTGSDDNRDTNNNDRPPGVPRNSLTGPGFFEVDVELSKSIQLRSDRVEVEGGGTGPIASGGYYGQRTGVRMTLSASATNLLNKVNFQSINGVMSSSFFGRPTRARDARRISLQVRFNF